MHSLCTALCSHPILALPDFTKPFCIESDASDTAVGGVFTQQHVSVHKPIALFNRTLSSSETNYSVHDHELFAIVTCYKAQRPYFDGQQAVVISDHKPLINLQT